MLLSRSSRVRRHGAGCRANRVAVEGLEQRELLSGATFHPDYELLAGAAVNARVAGFAPAQIRKAYGFDQVSLDGAGQTIAIVDAFNHPNIASDLGVFDAQFGLPAANISVVNQSGGSRLPATDAGWAGEISLDAEWAHAVAPAANILLVEANSASDTDLMAAVDYARHTAGVSAISMSWGGSEYFSFRGDESATQLAFDTTFATPAGHQGVTFVASAGDSGFNNGVQWPASSPNVVAVGGTSLQTSDASGTYFGEGPWRGFRNGTSGGFSQVEVEPAYQQAAQQSGARSSPDVGYDGDPNTGFAVYDSVPFNGSSGWDVVGGTSAGAPQWAALVALANQGRVQAGKATLDGRADTLPDLYSVYSPPGTAGYSTYTSFFNDIGSDGYGYTTGLGTPRAEAVISTLVGTPVGGGSGAGSGDGSGNVPPAPAQLPASPLNVALVTVPAAGIGGQNTAEKVRVTNTTSTRFTGPVSVTLYASTDTAVSTDDTAVATLTLPKLNLRPSGSKNVVVKFARPDSLPDGAYDYIASVTATGTGTAPAEAATAIPVAIESPKVDLATTFATGRPITLNSNRPSTATVVVRNEGNVTATGTLDLSLYASDDATLDDADVLLADLSNRRIHLRPGKSLTMRVRIPAAGSASAAGFVLASTTPATTPADADASNNLAAGPIT